MIKVNLLAIWYGCCVSTLVFSCLLLLYTWQEQQIVSHTKTYRLFQALPDDQRHISDAVGKEDARIQILEDFLKRYKSPMAEFSHLFIEVSDQYQLDHRLLPAIAMQESNGGRKVPAGSFNPFGYGIYGGKAIYFDSWDDAIKKVGKELQEDYISKGLTTPAEIMTKYTPPSIEKGGPWAMGVSQFMYEQR